MKEQIDKCKLCEKNPGIYCTPMGVQARTIHSIDLEKSWDILTTIEDCPVRINKLSRPLVNKCKDCIFRKSTLRLYD